MLSVYTSRLIKIVSYYDLSVLSPMSLMGFHKKSLDGRCVGGVRSIQVFLEFWNFFNFAKPLAADVDLEGWARDYVAFTMNSQFSRGKNGSRDSRTRCSVVLGASSRVKRTEGTFFVKSSKFKPL